MTQKRRRNRLPDGRVAANKPSTVKTKKPFNWTIPIFVVLLIIGFVIAASR
ncbi:MAG: hypothetical protein WC451_04510 [Patescibacteria group bacterium]